MFSSCQPMQATLTRGERPKRKPHKLRQGLTSRAHGRICTTLPPLVGSSVIAPERHFRRHQSTTNKSGTQATRPGTGRSQGRSHAIRHTRQPPCSRLAVNRRPLGLLMADACPMMLLLGARKLSPISMVFQGYLAGAPPLLGGGTGMFLVMFMPDRLACRNGRRNKNNCRKCLTTESASGLIHPMH